MGTTSKLIVIAAITAAIGAVVTVVVSNHFDAKSDTQTVQKNGVRQPSTTGTIYQNTRASVGLTNTPQTRVYQGAGNQASNSSFNGQIYTKRFTPGGNHNAGGTGGRERSGAFQTATKNPFGNGTNTTYAGAVSRATQDPTNQVTALVLGPGRAIND